MRKILVTIAAVSLFALPAMAQNLDEIPATAPTDRGPNEQVTPSTPENTVPAVDGATTQTVEPALPVEPSTSEPVVPGTDDVGGSGIDPATNQQSDAFGSNSN